MRGQDFVDTARMLVGVPFRPQGRNPALGLDCVGLAALAYHVPVERLPDDYRLSGSGHGERLKAALATEFRRVSRTKRRVGDLLLCRPSRDQWHLAIQSDEGAIHADAKIGRVVEAPGLLPWPLAAVFRRRQRRR